MEIDFMKQKHNFSSKIGFILAAAGSAVGLGNIWRFPYLAVKYGGGSFLLVYLILAVTFGFALMITEIAIGRRTGKSALYAFSSLNKKCKFIGVLASIVPIIILPYYCVIGGWVVKYAWAFVSGDFEFTAYDDYFTGFISQTGEPVLCLAIFVILTMIVILLGVNKGIETVSKILMPILVLMSLFIAGYVITRPGAAAGLEYYLKPDLSKINANAFLAAMGQLFYSMSLAMGIMITYGSYLSKKDNIESSVRNIEIFDTGIAFLSGLIIAPAVFVFSGGDAEAVKQGPTLMFVTLPKVFISMKGGHFIGILFFVLVLFAALTSAISLMETVVSIFENRLNISRKWITLLVTVYTLLFAIPSSLGFGVWSGFTLFGMSILDFFDFISNSVLMPIVALLTCIFVGYIVKPKTVIDEVLISSDRFKSQKLYVFIIKYLAPIFIVLILISSILNALGINTL